MVSTEGKHMLRQDTVYTQKRAYGRAQVGQKVNRVVVGQRGRNVTMIKVIYEDARYSYNDINDRGLS